MSLLDGELETAAEMVAALRAGEVNGAALVERARRRAERWQPFTNAFSQLWDGVPPGIPFAVKDLYDVAGRETSGCSEAYRGRVADRDAPLVRLAVEAGLAIVGKTNQHELAAGGTNLVSACGRTGNPWDPARMTGGSSGGSAAAVAAGVVPWAYGSDTGGSVRTPASMCGTFGLKPTTGRLSIEGMLPLAPSLDCPGPLAATAGDLRALWRIMAGPPGDDEVEPAVRPRIAVAGGFYAEHVRPEVLRSVDETAAALGRAGAEVRDPIGDDEEAWGGGGGPARPPPGSGRRSASPSSPGPTRASGTAATSSPRACGGGSRSATP